MRSQIDRTQTSQRNRNSIIEASCLPAWHLHCIYAPPPPPTTPKSPSLALRNAINSILPFEPSTHLPDNNHIRNRTHSTTTTTTTTIRERSQRGHRSRQLEREAADQQLVAAADEAADRAGRHAERTEPLFRGDRQLLRQSEVCAASGVLRAVRL